MATFETIGNKLFIEVPYQEFEETLKVDEYNMWIAVENEKTMYYTINDKLPMIRMGLGKILKSDDGFAMQTYPIETLIEKYFHLEYDGEIRGEGGLRQTIYGLVLDVQYYGHQAEWSEYLTEQEINSYLDSTIKVSPTNQGYFITLPVLMNGRSDVDQKSEAYVRDCVSAVSKSVGYKLTYEIFSKDKYVHDEDGLMTIDIGFYLIMV